MDRSTENKIKEKKDLPGLRKSLSQKKKLEIIEVFDTFKKTSGEKDVSLCQNQQGKKVILRIGEIRPKSFFPGGYRGKYFVVPKIYKSQKSEIRYEIVEYLEGKLVNKADPQSSKSGQIDLTIGEKLLNAFWEFQNVGRKIELESKFKKEKVLKHFEKAKKLMANSKVVQELIDRYDKSWQKQHPSKWKFSTDNLMLMPNKKIGFIDNTGVGLRFFGYDLGWLLWPRWVEMETEKFDQVAEHFAYLDNFKELAQKVAPPEELETKDFEKKFWLIIFERLIGAVYDVAQNMRHLAYWGMGPKDDQKRKEKHLTFLNSLLEKVIKNL